MHVSNTHKPLDYLTTHRKVRLMASWVHGLDADLMHHPPKEITYVELCITASTFDVGLCWLTYLILAQHSILYVTLISNTFIRIRNVTCIYLGVLSSLHCCSGHPYKWVRRVAEWCISVLPVDGNVQLGALWCEKELPLRLIHLDAEIIYTIFNKHMDKLQ